MELNILELPPEYVQTEQSPTETTAANDSDDDFQDPPSPINNRGKEKLILIRLLLRSNQGAQSVIFRISHHPESFLSNAVWQSLLEMSVLQK